MNFKSIFGLKASSDLSPTLQAMADRVSTAEGCDALAAELDRLLQEAGPIDPRTSLLRRKSEEVARVKKAHVIADERVRVAAVVKRDQDAASKALKSAESRLKAATEEAGKAASALSVRTAEIGRMNADLAELHAAADQAVELARKGFSDAMEAGDVGAEGEAAAFEAVKKAQAHRASVGDLLRARIANRQSGLAELERANAAAAESVSQAQDDVSLARIQLARVEYDQAAQSMVDAYVKLSALRTIDSAGSSFAGSTIHKLDLTFASAERAVRGDQLIGESGRVRDWVLQDMSKALAPADLELLSRGLPQPKQPEQPLDLPNPFLFMDGTLERGAAERDLSRATRGMDESQAEDVRNRLRVQADAVRRARELEPLAR